MCVYERAVLQSTHLALRENQYDRPGVCAPILTFRMEDVFVLDPDPDPFDVNIC